MGLLPLLLILISIIVLGATWAYIFLYQPLKKLRSWTAILAEGHYASEAPIRGLWGIDAIASHVAMIYTRMARLSERASSEKVNLDAIVSSMSEGVIVTDADYTIILANHAIRVFLGEREREIEGRKMEEVFSTRDVFRLVRAAMVKNKQYKREITMPGEKGDVRHIAVAAVPLQDALSENKGVVTVFHDLTPMRKVEIMRREFVANVSHELRTPLAVFQGYLETMLDHTEWLAPEALRITKVLQKHSQRLNKLVNDLLTLSRLDLGQIPLFPASIQVKSFLEDIRDDWTRTFVDKGCTLEVLPTEEMESLVVEADPLRIEQVLYNLIDNALKFSQVGDKVEIGCIRLRSRKVVQFFVKDQGAGISPEKLPYVFDRFYRADSSRAREMGGAGLGLSIVKNIVEMHKGRIFAESEFETGTRMAFTLPVQFSGLVG